VSSGKPAFSGDLLGRSGIRERSILIDAAKEARYRKIVRGKADCKC
jgi:hypothetical protein